MDEQPSMQQKPIQYYGATPCPAPQILLPLVHGKFQQPPSSPYANAPALSLTASLNQLAYRHRKQQEEVEICWANQMQGFEPAINLRNHSLPLARIKKIMKSDEHVRMISAEAPVVFAKACEMFISELTLRAWNHIEATKRRTLQKNDIAAAINRTDIFDFLIDILPRDELKEHQVIKLGTPISSLSVGNNSYNAAVANSFHRYYSPNLHSVPHGVTVGEPMRHATYMQQPRSPVDYVQNLLGSRNSG